MKLQEHWRGFGQCPACNEPGYDHKCAYCGHHWYAEEKEPNVAEKRDYLAIILVGAGSSYARGPDKEKAIKRVAKIAVQDWGSLFQMKSTKAQVNVYDVTGHDSLRWDYGGVYGDNQPIERLELRDVIL